MKLYLVYCFEKYLELVEFKKRAIEQGYLERIILFSPPGTSEKRRCACIVDENFNPFNQAIIYGSTLYIPLHSKKEIPKITGLIE